MSELERLNKALKSAFIKIGIYRKSDMAEYLGYKSPYFSGVINGKEKLSDQFLKNISDKIGINPDYILKGEGEMIVNKQESENNKGTGIIGNNLNKASINDNTVVLEMIDLLRKKDEQIERLINLIEKGGKNHE